MLAAHTWEVEEQEDPQNLRRWETGTGGSPEPQEQGTETGGSPEPQDVEDRDRTIPRTSGGGGQGQEDP